LSTTRVAGCDTYHDYSIVDEVVIPKSLAAGDYLLSWRWDCEQTHQIWQNCADVSITN
jgi:methionine-rich copper-binding protein CopC